MQNINHFLNIFQNSLSIVTSANELEQIRTKYLGRNGTINQLLKEIRECSPPKRKELGKKVNNLKNSIIRLIEVKQKELFSKTDKKEYFDITLPGKIYPKGSLHIMTLATEEISKIFQGLGFVRMTYPEIEWEYFSFDSLNMPKGHPSRDDFETLFIDAPSHSHYGKMILSPHTSSCQVREMLRVGQPPIRMINIAKCYRPNWDATHTPMFYQFEGLCIDRGINITHLKGTVNYFAKEFFGSKGIIRLRPHHFQFTEPSFEIDIICTNCSGKGMIDEVKCQLCKSGWLELAGAGMVHPNVLKAGKIDPDEYSGWAFAFGIERILMVREKIDNIRFLYSSDIRFLEQF
jgi:phenylalanyl-tRNA synthetase alpha chain